MMRERLRAGIVVLALTLGVGALGVVGCHSAAATTQRVSRNGFMSLWPHLRDTPSGYLETTFSHLRYCDGGSTFWQHVSDGQHEDVWLGLEGAFDFDWSGFAEMYQHLRRP